jgi:hypothetical protein
VKKLLGMLVAAVMVTALPARASVLLDPHLSGTGDNVIADTTSITSALGHLNSPNHLDVVDYTNLTVGFTGAASGNDIKIDNTTAINIQVFDPTNTFVVPTFTQVFSLKGTGDVNLSVQANDGTFIFDLGVIDPNAQSGFTISAINGESIISLALLDLGGTITDFEHNRIDIAPAIATTPLPATVWLFASGLGGLLMLGSRRRKQGRQLVLATK